MKILNQKEFNTLKIDFDAENTFGQAKYDWSSIFIGKPVVLAQGEDYTCNDNAMKMQAINAGKKQGIVVKAKVLEKGKVVVQSFGDADDETKAQWDAEFAEKRAKQKARGIEKRAAAKNAANNDSELEETEEEIDSEIDSEIEEEETPPAPKGKGKKGSK